jgi:hypothetical protein
MALLRNICINILYKMYYLADFFKNLWIGNNDIVDKINR